MNNNKFNTLREQMNRLYGEDGYNVLQIAYRGNEHPYAIPIAKVNVTNTAHDAYGHYLQGVGCTALTASVIPYNPCAPSISRHMTFRALCLHLWSLRVYDLPVYYFTVHGVYRIMIDKHGICYRFKAIRVCA